MRRLLIAIFTVLALVLIWVGSYLAAAESGEVVVLHAGDTETRLWIVDHDGASWLRGQRESAWMEALRANPEVVVDRGDERLELIAEPVPEELATVNALMAEKYGLGHRYIGFFVGGWKNALPVRLTPREDSR